MAERPVLRMVTRNFSILFLFLHLPYFGQFYGRTGAAPGVIQVAMSRTGNEAWITGRCKSLSLSWVIWSRLPSQSRFITYFIFVFVL